MAEQLGMRKNEKKESRTRSDEGLENRRWEQRIWHAKATQSHSYIRVAILVALEGDGILKRGVSLCLLSFWTGSR